MSKKVDTDDRNLDEMLEALAKPKPLEHKEKGESSQGRDAVEYHAAPHAPAARADHNTFPDAPIIVNQTNPLNITPEERKKLEGELERRAVREREERNAETAPRRTDPPGVATDPQGIPKKSLAKPVGALALVALLVVVIAIAMRSKPNGSSSAVSATTSTTSATASIQPTAIATHTAAPTYVAPTTAEIVRTAPTATSVAHPIVTHTSVAPPPTVTSAAPTATATSTGTVVAPPDLRGSN